MANAGRYPFSILILIVMSSGNLFSQQKLNLDFEKLSIEGVARPWGWAIYSYSPTVSFVCDTTQVRSGQYSLMISDTAATHKNQFELSYFIEPSQILNRTLTIEGWAKSEGFTGTSGIKLESIGKVNEAFGTITEDQVAIQATGDWGKFASEINIGARPHSVLLTIYFAGTGKIWYDNLQLKVGGKKVDEVPVAPQFTKKQQRILRQKTVPFATVEPSVTADLSASDFKDLAYFKNLIGDAQLIALGESTHGTSEFFKVKHRLLQYAILELGVRVFVLEDNQLLVERVNDYVLYGKGEARSSMKGLFAVWNTEEMLQLIKWLRKYNIAHPDAMVEFVGMDVQNPQLALDNLDLFLQEKDNILQIRSNDLLSEIKEDWRNSYFKTDSILKNWDADAALNYELMAKNQGKWLQKAKNKADSLKIIWAIKNARTVKQFTETTLGGVYEGRDKAMAENIEWILAQRPRGTRVVIWAHDSHVSRGEATEAEANFFLGHSMGSYLSQAYGDRYRAFGLFTYEGQCLGTISYSNFKQIPFQIYTSPKGSLDEGLHQVAGKLHQPNLMLDLRPFRDQPDRFAWMHIKRPVRYVGYVAEDYGFGGRYKIPFQFDGIIFIDSTSASKKPE